MTFDIERKRTRPRLISAASVILRRATDILRAPKPDPHEIMRPDNLNDHLLRDIGLSRNEAHEKFESVRERWPPS